VLSASSQGILVFLCISVHRHDDGSFSGTTIYHHDCHATHHDGAIVDYFLGFIQFDERRPVPEAGFTDFNRGLHNPGNPYVIGHRKCSRSSLGGPRLSAWDKPEHVVNHSVVGLLALCGLAFGRQRSDLKALLLMVFCSGLLALEIVRTGSRGSIVALIMSLMAFPLKKTKRFASKLGIVLAGILVVGFLVWASFSIKSVRERWESTFETGETAGRNTIYSNALDMFLEKPILGWGPVTHRAELGSRLGLPFRDTHNLYLYILTETGILGGIPFFIGLWLCLQSAWKARDGFQGSCPLPWLLVCSSTI